MIDSCLGVTAIGLRIIGVGLLSTIVAAPAVIGMEAVSIVMGLLRVVGNRAIKKLSLKIEKHEEIAMLAVSTLHTISRLIPKALSDNSITDEEYSQILLEFETLTRKKEDIREYLRWALKETGNIETEANELLRRNKIGVPPSVHAQNHVQNRVQNHVQNHLQNRVRNHVQIIKI